MHYRRRIPEVNVIAMIEYGLKIERIGVREFPPFIRVTLKDGVRKKLFSRAMKDVKTVKRVYTVPADFYDRLYGKKGIILNLLSEKPQTARMLKAASGLGSSTVYQFLGDLKTRHIISKKSGVYSLEYDFDTLFLDEIVRLEEEPALRRKYGISIKELELSYYLWDSFTNVAPEERCYAQTYCSTYTLADAVHRWRTGRTAIPVWALRGLGLSESDITQTHGIIQYHLPPGIVVTPSYRGEYKLPILATGDLDKIFIQLSHKMSANHLYIFPKKKEWLFEKLHTTFGEFDDTTSRIPSAIVEILKWYYSVETLDKHSACIPPRITARWSELNPLLRVVEESSLLLHIISLASRSSGGFEITSRSQSFLQDIAATIHGLGLGTLNLSKKRGRPHFRVYLSEDKANALRRYTRLFQEYPDLEIWLKIPLNQIAQKLRLSDVNSESVDHICREELSLFVESILRSLEKKGTSWGRLHYCTFKKEVLDYFWRQKLIPSPRSVKELAKMLADEEENVLYV
jgi:hypothetical protein